MWLVAAAFGMEAVEEVTVWGDDFARWRRRWYVETEVHFAQAMTLSAWVNNELSIVALQVRAVLDCDVDFVLGPQGREVSCRIEDIGLVARPRLFVDTNAAVLEEADVSLTGASVQLQVKASGAVPNVDLEGIPWTNRRQRARAEQLRQLMSRVVLPFHLKLDEPVHDGARWFEYNSPLFLVPSFTATQAGSTMAHFLNWIDDDHFVVQTIGEATIREGDFLMHGDMHGVSLLRRADGILTERVWVIRAEHTASSRGVLYGGHYYYAGRLRMLAQDGVVDVGATWIARSPRSNRDDNPEWVSLSF